MSSISENSALLAILSELKNGMLDISSRMSALESSKPSAPAAAGGAGKGKAKKEKKAKDPSAPKREPTVWRIFADRVRGVLKDNGFSGTALGTECVQFCSSLKTENADLASWTSEDILARRAAWTKPEVSKAEAKFGKNWVKNKSWRKTPEGSVVSGAADGEEEAADGEAAPAKKARKNPWEGLSEAERAERIAKMKAGREAKKAAADALLEDEPLGASAAEIKAAAAKKAGRKVEPLPPKTEAAAPKTAPEAPKKASAAPAASVSNAAASSSSASAAATSSGEFKPVMLNGERFWINLQTGHAYHRLSDGGQGDWAGIFSKTPKPHIDDSVPEPGAEAEEEELNFDDE